MWAARLWGAAEALRYMVGSPLPPVFRADYERSVTAARTQLGEKAFTAAWAEGRAMTPEQALDAQGPVTPTKPLSPRRALKQQFGGLTSRECEVARLVAQGKSNRAIADELVVGVSAVEAHISHIFTKLGFSSRAQIAAWAVDKGLAQVPQDMEVPRKKH